MSSIMNQPLISSEYLVQRIENVEVAWMNAITQLQRGNREIVLPAASIGHLGEEGKKEIARRYEALLDAKPSVFFDASHGVIRFMPPPDVEPSVSSPLSSCASSPGPVAGKRNPSAKIAKSRMNKVPRPPNAFILYRQKQHRVLKAANPSLANNEISTMVGRMWREESQVVRNEYITKADEIKKQHAIDNPDYQYQPRKPSEKKRRASRKHANATPLLAETVDVHPELQQKALPAIEQDFVPDFRFLNNRPIATVRSGQCGTLDMMAEQYNNNISLTNAAEKNGPSLVAMSAPMKDTGSVESNAQVSAEFKAVNHILTQDQWMDHKNYISSPARHPANPQAGFVTGGASANAFESDMWAEFDRQHILEWDALNNDPVWIKDVENMFTTIGELDSTTGDGSMDDNGAGGNELLISDEEIATLLNSVIDEASN